MGRHGATDVADPRSRGRDGTRPRRRRWVWSALVLVALLAAGGVTWWTVGRDDGCARRTPISVAADPSMTTPLKTVASTASERSCYDYTVVAVSASGIAGRLTSGSGAPDLWVADSTRRAQTVTRQVGIPTDVVAPSIASTPAVVAGRSVPRLATWVDVMKLPDVRIGSPLSSSTGNAPIVGALSAVEQGRLSTKDLTDAMTVLAIQQGNVRPQDDSEEGRLALAAASTAPAVTTEQEFLAYRAAHPDAQLSESVPASGTVFLEHPLVVTAGPSARDSAREAGRRLADAMGADTGRSALRTAGYRPVDRSPLPGAGVGVVAPVILRDPSRQDTTLRQWSVLSEPIRTLVAMDASGSMTERVDNSTRADLLVQAALTGNTLFPNNTELGLWYFGVNKGGPGKDWIETAPIEREDAVRADGATHRDFLNTQVRGYQRFVGGGTGLYDTTLAAYRQVLDTYDPNYSNSIIVLTDGRNEDPGSISLPQLLSRIRALQDPARPIDIVTIGISDDADTDALNQIADLAPAGTTYVTRDPRQIPSVLVDAVSARIQAAGR